MRQRESLRVSVGSHLLHNEDHNGQVEEKEEESCCRVRDENESRGEHMPLVDDCEFRQNNQSPRYVVEIVATDMRSYGVGG